MACRRIYRPRGFSSSPGTRGEQVDLRVARAGATASWILRARLGSAACSLGLLLFLPIPALAAVSGDWEAVRALDAGRRIRVVLDEPSGTVVAGRFDSATADQVAVRTRDGGTQTFQRGNVHQVRLRVPYWRRKISWAVGLSCAALGIVAASISDGPVGADGTMGDATAQRVATPFVAFGVCYALFGEAGSTSRVYTAAPVPDASQPKGSGTGSSSRTNTVPASRQADARNVGAVRNSPGR